MQISALIPSHNRLPTLVRALESVRAQTSTIDEIIVVDDGSTDGTAAQITALFPEVRLIVQPNRGVSAARNAGILNTTSTWIALLDSDDIWLPNKIESIRTAQQQQPQYNLFHSDEIWVRNGVRVNPCNKHRKSAGWIFQQCLPLCVISPSAAVIRRDLLLSIGLFNERLPVCEDYDLWLRICHQEPVCYISQALVTKYGGHPDQLSRRYWGMDRFRVRALRQLLDTAKLTVSDRQATQAMLAKKVAILLKGARKHGNQAILDEFQTLQHADLQTRDCSSC